MRDVSDLMNAISEKEFNSIYDVMRCRLPSSFINYMDKMVEDIKGHASRYQFKKLNLINKMYGVTNNGSESINCVLKKLVQWREVPVDVLILALYHIQQYYHYSVYNILSALCDTGNYLLKDEFRIYKQDASLINFPPSVKNPDTIVDQIKNGYYNSIVNLI